MDVPIFDLIDFPVTNAEVITETTNNVFDLDQCFELVKEIESFEIDLIENNILDEVCSNKEINQKSKEIKIKRKRGKTKIDLNLVKNSTKVNNILRCRKYRSNLKSKNDELLQELRFLQNVNSRLSNKVKNLEDSIKKLKDNYIDSIKSGDVKFENFYSFFERILK